MIFQLRDVVIWHDEDELELDFVILQVFSKPLKRHSHVFTEAVISTKGDYTYHLSREGKREEKIAHIWEMLGNY